MGKRSRKKSSTKGNSKTKFTVIGIVTVIVAVIAIASLMNPELASPSNTSETSKLSIDTRNGSPVLGDLSSPVTIIEFGDYQCPFCQRWNENTKPIIEKNYIDSGLASLIYVDLPIVGPDSFVVHAGSYCAEEQNLYWFYHDFVYSNQGHENDGWANSENVKLLASKIPGLDTDSFNECLDSKKYEQRVNENKKIAQDSGARSTPSFIIISPDGSGETITGAQPFGTFKAVIDQMLVQ